MMSCVAILISKKSDFNDEFRVSILGSLDSLFYDHLTESISQDQSVILENARILFHDSKPLFSREIALNMAKELQYDYKTDDGIKFVTLPTTLEDF